MTPRPPRSTLFPYTTLFRSMSSTRPRFQSFMNAPTVHLAGLFRSAPHPQVVGARSLGGQADDLDRKSTRLNSSHSQISYAVFCLKKKKKQNNYIRIYYKNTT